MFVWAKRIKIYVIHQLIWITSDIMKTRFKSKMISSPSNSRIRGSKKLKNRLQYKRNSSVTPYQNNKRPSMKNDATSVATQTVLSSINRKARRCVVIAELLHRWIWLIQRWKRASTPQNWVERTRVPIELTIQATHGTPIIYHPQLSQAEISIRSCSTSTITTEKQQKKEIFV